MLNIEFEDYFQKCPAVLPHFLGVYSINTFPKKLKTKTFFITNMSKSHDLGSHWVSIVKSSPNVVEIFDSLGTKYDILKPYLNFQKNQILFLMTVLFNYQLLRLVDISR